MKALALLLALLSAGAGAAPVSFAIFGDTPYTHWERQRLPDLIAAMDRENPAFIVHIGDIKAGSAECADARFMDILGVFDAAQSPFIYLPGDNEWTDCHRKSNGRYDPEERLATLRRLFLSKNESLGRRRIVLERQPAYPENTRWETQGILFVTLNVTGSNNNYHGTEKGSGPVPEFVARNAANHQWLAASFARAREKKLAGLLLAIQANPEFESANAGHVRPGFRDFLQQLREETQAFAGQVVLAHGDTHHQQIDQPMRDAKTRETVKNFTRVETFGSPFFGWIKATADAADPKVFRFHPQVWQAPLQAQ